MDDNFIGDKNRTRALLREMVAWRRRTRASMGFLTEASVNLVDDEELCALTGGFSGAHSCAARVNSDSP